MNDILYRIHPVCEAFESELQSGSTCVIETYLAGFEGEDRRVLFTNLLEVEVDYRHRRGQIPALGEYLPRFPDYGDLIVAAGVNPSRADGIPSHLGDHVILRELGRGGMGVVYEAFHRGLGRKVALKVLRPEVACSELAVERFLHESRAVARLHHTHIVPVFDVGREGQTTYFSMQLIDGAPLDALAAQVASCDETSRLAVLYRRDRALFVSEVTRIGVAIADAVEHAHRRGILHRDLKPANILCEKGGHPWLADFGLAQTGGVHLTLPGDVVGTLRYLAPERLRGEATPRSDVYGLGASLYELLSLAPVFSAKDRVHLLHAIANEEPPPLRKKEAAVGESLSAVIAKAMAKDPQDRYGTAAEFREDLHCVFTDQPVVARRASLRQQLVRWMRRNRQLAVALTALLTLILAGLVASLIIGSTLSRKNEENRRLAGSESEQRRKTTRLLYLSEMRSAGLSVSAGDGAARIRTIINRWRPAGDQEDHRGWEWFFLEAFAGEEVRVIQNGRVNFGVDWLPGDRALVCGSAGRVSVRPLDPGESPRQRVDATLPAFHRGDLHGSRRALVRPDGTLAIVDLSSGEDVFTLPGAPAQVEVSAFDVSGRRLAVWSASEGSLQVWDLESRTRIALLPQIGRRFAWSPDGATIAAIRTPAQQAVLIDTSKWSLRDISGCSARCFAWHPGGHRLAIAITTASGANQIEVVEPEDGRLLATLSGHRARIEDLEYSRGGARLASCGKDATIRIWNLSGRLERIFSGHERTVQGIAFNSTGTQLASASADGTLRIWPLNKRPPLSTMDMGLSREALFRSLARRTQCVPPLAWSEDSLRVGGTIEGNSRWFELSSGLAAPAPKPVAQIDGGVLVLHPGDRQRRLPGASFRKLLSTSPRRDFIVARAGPGDGAEIWLVDTKKLGDCRLVGRVSIRNLFVIWGRDQRAFIVGGRNFLWVVDTATGSIRARLAKTGLGIHSAAFSPDGREVAFTSAARGIRLWNLRSGKIRILEGHSGRSWCVAYHPAGTRLATGGRDRMVRIWDLESGREVLSLMHEEEVAALSWDPTGTILATLSEGGLLRSFDATAGYDR